MFAKNFRCLLLLISVSPLLSHAENNDLILRIDIVKDTIRIGEPIIMRGILKNQGSRATEISRYGSTTLLSYGTVEILLSIPESNREYRYGVFENYIGVEPTPQFILQPNESVYFYIVMCWSGPYGGFVYQGDSLPDFLRYNELSPGIYKIRARYFLYKKDKRVALVSNQDSFYAIPMSDDEHKIWKEVGTIIDRYFGWPENILREDRAKAFEIFPEIIESGTILAHYCHYILCKISFSKGPEAEKALTLVEEFLKKYPNTPLAEKITFDLYYYYLRQNDLEKAKMIVQQALQQYPDYLDGYIFLKLPSKSAR